MEELLLPPGVVVLQAAVLVVPHLISSACGFAGSNYGGSARSGAGVA